jgi:hypothetical protein
MPKISATTCAIEWSFERVDAKYETESVAATHSSMKTHRLISMGLVRVIETILAYLRNGHNYEGGYEGAGQRDAPPGGRRGGQHVLCGLACDLTPEEHDERVRGDQQHHADAEAERVHEPKPRDHGNGVHLTVEGSKKCQIILVWRRARPRTHKHGGSSTRVSRTRRRSRGRRRA